MGQLNTNNRRRPRPAEPPHDPSKRAPVLAPFVDARPAPPRPVVPQPAPGTPAPVDTPFRARALAFACGRDAALGAASPLRVLPAALAHTVLALAAPPRVVTAAQDGTARVWELETGCCTAVCRGHRGGVLCVAAAGSRVCTGGADTTVRVWDAATGACVRVLRDSRHHVMALCIVRDSDNSSGDSMLVCGSKDGHVRVYGLADGGLRATVAAAGPVCSLVHDAAAHTVVAGLANGTLLCLDTRTWAPRGAPVRAHSSLVNVLHLGLSLALPPPPPPPSSAAGQAEPAQAAAAPAAPAAQGEEVRDEEEGEDEDDNNSRGGNRSDSGERRERRTIVSMSNMMQTAITVWDADTWERVAHVEDRDAVATDVQMVARAGAGRRPCLVATTQAGAVVEYDALTGARTRVVVPPLRSIPARCLVVLPARSIDLGNAWYTSTKASTDAATDAAAAAAAPEPMLPQDLVAQETGAAERDAAAREHAEDEAAAVQAAARTWPAGVLGACPVTRAARALVAGLLSGACSVCDFPRGDRVLTLPVPQQGRGHTDAVNAVAVLEPCAPSLLP